MARKGFTIATELFGATRVGCSVNGNPRFELHTADGTYRTQSDASCSYDVDNITRTIPHGQTLAVTLHATPAGRVWNVERGHALSCGHVPTRDGSAAASIGTGYAETRDGRKLCYRCADGEERAAFARADSFVAYVNDAGDLTTWPGGFLARGLRSSVSRSGWHGSEVHAWRFRAEDGSEWYGRNAGPGMVIRVRRAKP